MEKQTKYFEIKTPEMAIWLLSFLFQKYGSIDAIRKKYSGGLVIYGPGDRDDDHGKTDGERRHLLVIAGVKNSCLW